MRRQLDAAREEARPNQTGGSMKPILVGIAGGSGSGKTTVARRIEGAFEDTHLVCLDMDSYYKDLGHMTMPERRQVNFDHPDAFDTELFVSHLRSMRAGEEIAKPVYDFSRSTRTSETVPIAPTPLVLVEGIMVLAVEEVREMLDAKIFVATDGDIRFIRRLERDVSERGRSLESVIAQYMETVRPMHHAFVEPSQRYADIIIPRGGKNRVAINMLIADLRAKISQG
jgi:uridine kinase